MTGAWRNMVPIATCVSCYLLSLSLSVASEQNQVPVSAMERLEGRVTSKVATNLIQTGLNKTAEAVVAAEGRDELVRRAVDAADGHLLRQTAARANQQARTELTQWVEGVRSKSVRGKVLNRAAGQVGPASGIIGAYAGNDSVGVEQELTHGAVDLGLTAGGAAAGAAGGATLGAWLGGAAGTLFPVAGPLTPVLGVGVGKAVGGTVGGFAGGVAGSVAGSEFKDSEVATSYWDNKSNEAQDAAELKRRKERAALLFREAGVLCNAANRVLDLGKASVDAAVRAATTINGKRAELGIALTNASTVASACTDASNAQDELTDALSDLNEQIDKTRSSQFGTMNLASGVCLKSAEAANGTVPAGGLAQATTDAKSRLAEAKSKRGQAEQSLAEAIAASQRLKTAHARVKKMAEDGAAATKRLEGAKKTLEEAARIGKEAKTSLADADTKLGQARADFESCRRKEDQARNALLSYMDREEVVTMVTSASGAINMRYDRIAELEPQIQPAREYLETEQSALPAVRSDIDARFADLAACGSLRPRTGEVEGALNQVKSYQSNLSRDLKQAIANGQSCVDQLVAMADSPQTTADGGGTNSVDSGGGSASDGNGGSNVGADEPHTSGGGSTVSEGTSETDSGSGGGGVDDCDPTNPVGGCYNPLADPNTVAGGGSGGSPGGGGSVDPGAIPELDEPSVPGSGGTQNVPTPGQPIDPGYTDDPIQDVQDTERVIEAEKSPGGPFTPRAPEQPGSDIADDFGTPPDIADIPDRDKGGGSNSGGGGGSGAGGGGNTNNTGGGNGGTGGSGTATGGSGSGGGSTDTGPVTQTASCNDTNEAGSNKPERYTIDVGSGKGDITFSWTMYTIKDQMSVSGAGVSFSTGCVSGSDSVTLNKSGGAAQITVDIAPNCDPDQKGRTTKWNFSVSCPAN